MKDLNFVLLTFTLNLFSLRQTLFFSKCMLMLSFIFIESISYRLKQSVASSAYITYLYM